MLARVHNVNSHCIKPLPQSESRVRYGVLHNFLRPECRFFASVASSNSNVFDSPSKVFAYKTPSKPPKKLKLMLGGDFKCLPNSLKDVLIVWLIVLVEIPLGKFPCS